jgi:hypothetical protein
MNLKGLSVRRYRIIIALLLWGVFAFISIGCATRRSELRNMAVVSRYFDRDVNTVWDAVTQSVEGISIEIKDKEQGVLKTHWVKDLSIKRTTGLFLEENWQGRYRLLIKVTGEQSKSYVSINTQIEEKAPGGSRAFRWNRITSDGTLEQDYLKKLENILDSQ